MARKKDDPADAALDALLEGAKTGEDVDAVFRQLKKRALERMLGAEMDEHLGYEKHSPEGFNGGNSRNGHSQKRVITDDGEVELVVPRDREGSFEPQVVKKRQRRLKGFDDKLIALYARGMSTRDIQAHIEEIYGVEVDPSLISRVTDQVLEEVQEWQNRPLDRVYPFVYLDAMVVKVRDNGVVANKTVYVVLANDMRGLKQVLGLWITNNEGAKFWMHVITELRNRGVNDILFACVDGLKGFPEAIEAVFPYATVQTCIVHVVRGSLNLVSWANRKRLAADLRTVYTAPNESAALEALQAFETVWGAQYPTISKAWRDNWARISPFYAFPQEIRRVIYTTNPIEGLHRQLRKVLKTRGAFPSDDAVIKVLWLAIDRASRKWTFPRKGWDRVVQQLAIYFEDRINVDDYAQR